MTDIATLGRVQHVYDFATLDRVPDGPTSLKVTAKRLLSGPTLQTGKSSTVGAVLAGSHIITTLGRQARGTGAKAHTHPNEQFNYVLEGTMMGDVEGDRAFASRGMHQPAIMWFARARSLNPHETKYSYTYAMSLRLLGCMKLAEEVCRDW